METIICDDENVDRTKKMKERFDHYLAQQVAEGDEKKESAEDPRQQDVEPISQEVPHEKDDEQHGKPEG